MPQATRPSRTPDPLPVYAVFGNDSFLRLRALDAVIGEVLGGDRDKMAVAEFDGPDAGLATVLDECRSASLLAPRRVVCVRDADDFVSDHREALERYLQKPCTGNTLVLVCRTWQRTTRLYKLVEQIGRNVACEAPKQHELPRWIADHASRTYGCSIDYEASERLADLVGPQLGLLDEELSKLATFVLPETTIGVAAVEELVGSSRAEKVFGLIDCIADRDASGALDLWEQVLATNRSAPYMAMGGLGYGFRNLADAKRLVRQGVSLFDAQKRSKLFGRPDQVQRRLNRFTLPQWRRLLVRLLGIDVGSKSGLGTVESSVEKLIVELCCA